MTSNLVVGADVGGTSVKYVVAAAGATRWQAEVPTDPTDPAATLARLAAAVAERLGDAGGQERIAAVGLACAGIVSPDTGRLGRSPNLQGWQDRDLGADVRAAFGSVFTVLANDVNAALYAEYRDGAGRGCRHLVMIALGTGVGGAVLVSGRLLTGFANGAGEIGHMTLDLAGPPCRCGNRGCLEAYCGNVGLVRQARRLAAASEASPAWRDLVAARGDALTARDCHELAEAGDPTARALFVEAGRRLGQATASLVNVLAPERVIVGGGVAQAGDLILDPCRAMVARHVMSEAGRETPVVPAALGTHAAAIGAALLADEAGAVP